MYCGKCGYLLPDEAHFCIKCGVGVHASAGETVVLRISGSPIEVYVETNSANAIQLCRKLHHLHGLPYEIIESPEQAGRRWKPGMACFYVKGNELDMLNLKESITMHLLTEGWNMQPATSLYIRKECAKD